MIFMGFMLFLPFLRENKILQLKTAIPYLILVILQFLKIVITFVLLTKIYNNIQV